MKEFQHSTYKIYSACVKTIKQIVKKHEEVDIVIHT